VDGKIGRGARMLAGSKAERMKQTVRWHPSAEIKKPPLKNKEVSIY
jgi:hypothetical protein